MENMEKTEKMENINHMIQNTLSIQNTLFYSIYGDGWKIITYALWGHDPIPRSAQNWRTSSNFLRPDWDFNLDAIFNSSLGLQWILKWKKISSGGVQSDLNHDKFSISGKRQALYSSKSGQHAKPIDSKWALKVIWFWLRLDSNIPEKILSNGMGWAFYMKVSTFD